MQYFLGMAIGPGAAPFVAKYAIFIEDNGVFSLG